MPPKFPIQELELLANLWGQGRADVGSEGEMEVTVGRGAVKGCLGMSSGLEDAAGPSRTQAATLSSTAG